MARIQLYAPFAATPFEDLFRGFFAPEATSDETRSPRSFRLDVVERNGQYVVQADLPGVARDDLQVTIEGNQVTINAEVKGEAERKEGERVLHTERYAGRLFRSFTLPVELDESASTARYENGVLELTLAKKSPVAGRKLTIQ